MIFPSKISHLETRVENLFVTHYVILPMYRKIYTIQLQMDAETFSPLLFEKLLCILLESV